MLVFLDQVISGGGQSDFAGQQFEAIVLPEGRGLVLSLPEREKETTATRNLHDESKEFCLKQMDAKLSSIPGQPNRRFVRLKVVFQFLVSFVFGKHR